MELELPIVELGNDDVEAKSLEINNETSLADTELDSAFDDARDCDGMEMVLEDANWPKIDDEVSGDLMLEAWLWLEPSISIDRVEYVLMRVLAEGDRLEVWLGTVEAGRWLAVDN